MSFFRVNDKCIGCKKCIKECPYIGANYINNRNNREIVDVNPDVCVSCGACENACIQGAREYEDDTLKFIEDLKKGEKISVMFIAPLMMHYPQEFMGMLGALQKLGAKRFINGAVGMSICKWVSINYIVDNNISGVITNQCSTVPEIIEKHVPELRSKIIPVHSPIACSAIYAKKYMHLEDKIEFISTCVARKKGVVRSEKKH